MALRVCRLRRAESGDTPAQTLGLRSLARAPRRGCGLQGQVLSCPSLFVLRGPGSPRPLAPSPPHAHLTPGVLLAKALVFSLVQGLLVEFHFRLQYKLVFRCVPCLLCWGRGGEALNTPPQSPYSCFLSCSPAHPSHYLPLPSFPKPLSPTLLPLDMFLI